MQVFVHLAPLAYIYLVALVLLTVLWDKLLLIILIANIAHQIALLVYQQILPLAPHVILGLIYSIQFVAQVAWMVIMEMKLVKDVWYVRVFVNSALIQLTAFLASIQLLYFWKMVNASLVYHLALHVQEFAVTVLLAVLVMAFLIFIAPHA